MLMTAWRGCALVALLLACSQAGAVDYFLTSRPAQATGYVYVGAGHLENGDLKASSLPIEFAYFTPSDWELALRTAVIDRSINGESDSGNGDVTFEATKFFRGLDWCDFIAVQGGVVAHSSHELLRSDTDGFVRFRTQFGPTRLKFEGNLFVAAVDSGPDFGDVRTIGTAGFRSQYGLFYWGLDLVGAWQHNADDVYATDLVLMNRFRNGTAVYATVEKGLKDSYRGTYFELAFEYSFGL